MNIATIIGILSGTIVLLYTTYSTTDNIAVFLNFEGIAIVVGGIAAATFICYPLKYVLQVVQLFLATLKREDLPIGDYINEIIYLSRKAYTKGELKLENELDTIENEFLKNGLRMVIDNMPIEMLAETLQTRINNTYEEELAKVGMFKTMAKLAPSFGMVGTLVGLIVMLQSMGAGDVAKLGPAMAVALTTTLYGVLLANLLFYPIAVKLENTINQRIVLMKVIMDGLLMTHAKVSPFIVREKLKAYIPQQKWASIIPHDHGGEK
ncbi:MAG: MotA/TolQ/ExbB proton channel family protein [Nitrospirae bacterium]|nr:MotA/TolQ/ExbB proton channel family protein [Nitrospirota bacterium]